VEHLVQWLLLESEDCRTDSNHRTDEKPTSVFLKGYKPFVNSPFQPMSLMPVYSSRVSTSDGDQTIQCHVQQVL